MYGIAEAASGCCNYACYQGAATGAFCAIYYSLVTITPAMTSCTDSFTIQYSLVFQWLANIHQLTARHAERRWIVSDVIPPENDEVSTR